MTLTVRDLQRLNPVAPPALPSTTAEVREWMLSGEPFPGKMSPLTLFEEFIFSSDRQKDLISKSIESRGFDGKFHYFEEMNLHLFHELSDPSQNKMWIRVTLPPLPPGEKSYWEIPINPGPPEQVKRSKNGYVYFIRAKGTDLVKIGFARHVFDRLTQLQTGCPTDLEVLLEIRGTLKDENQYQRKFSHLHVRGEWYRLAGSLKKFIKENGTKQ